MGRLVTISGPSGTGKGTIIARLLERFPEFRLRFSISATSRAPRAGEAHGVDYYFLSPEEFRRCIESGDLLEWEEVYSNRFYGTLRSEVNRIVSQGDNVVFDIDYIGALNIKKIYGAEVLTIFVTPPSLEELRRRLEGRGSETQESLESRLAKADLELSHSGEFDCLCVNDDLDVCIEAIAQRLRDFLG